MDEEIDAFEAELKALVPIAPSRTLEQRIAADLAPASRRAPVWRWGAFAALPVAAAVALVLTLPRPTTSTSPAALKPDNPAADVLKPVAAENVLYAARDEGVVTLADGTAARRERLNFVDTITWQNPRTHASLTWSIPREEVRVVPVRYE